MSIKNIVNDAARKEVDNFNKVINCRIDDLNESSIVGMLNWLKICECAFISAFRDESKDIRDENATGFGSNGNLEEGKVFSHKENREKNRVMVAKLLIKRYGVAKIKGVYPEGMTDENSEESSEESYLVVNRNNDPDFLNNLLRIAEYFNQDSIYYKEAGAEVGRLIDTNGCDRTEYQENGDDSKLQVETALNYMAQLGNKAFSFIGSASEMTEDGKSVMDSIENSEGTQIHWTDNDGTSFQARKEQRMKKLSEAVSFWRSIVVGDMKIVETMHPLTRKTMSEAIHKYKRTH